MKSQLPAPIAVNGLPSGGNTARIVETGQLAKKEFNLEEMKKYIQNLDYFTVCGASFPSRFWAWSSAIFRTFSASRWPLRGK